MAVNIGPRIGIDGEAQYRKELSNIIQQQKTLQSEMNVVTSSFAKNTTAEEKNTAVSKILAEQVKVQKERVEQLAAMLQKSAEKYGENDTKTLKWKEAVNSATSELNKMERELEESSKSTDNLGDAFGDAEKGAFSFGDALKANVLAQAIVDGVKRLASAIKDMAGDFIDTAAAVKAEASQFSQTFGDFSDDATAAIDRVANESGILDTRLNNLGTQIYAFARASGGSAEESMAMMEKALQATADSAAYYDRSLEDTAESLQSFLKGNYENDAALGLSATETTRNAAAMELFGQKFNDLTEIQKQQTLLQMVLDAQKLSGAMGQAARETDGWENVQGNLNEAWRQFQAQVGDPFLENLIPIIKDATYEIQEFTETADWDYFSDGVKSAVDRTKDFAGQVVTVGKKLLPMLGKAVGFAADNFETLTSVAISAYASIKVLKGISSVTTVISGFQKTVQAASTSMTLAQKAMTLLNLSMSTGAIGAVAVGIGALVAGFAALNAISKDAKTAEEVAAEAARKTSEAYREKYDAYQQQAEAAQAQADADIAQIDHAQDLWKELQKLADESGKVQEKDEARANFILGELNNALGTEYEMTGNQIQNYQDLADAIDTVIEKKKAQIYLDAAEESYRTAIQEITKLEKEQVDIYAEIAETEDKLTKKKQEYGKEAEKIAKQMADPYGSISESSLAYIQTLESEITALETHSGEMQSVFSKNETILREYYDSANKYESATTALLEGNAEKAIAIMQEKTDGIKNQNDLLGKSMEEQNALLYEQFKKADAEFQTTLQRFQDGVEGVTSEMVLEAYQKRSEAYDAYEELGIAIPSAAEEGIFSGKDDVDRAIQDVIGGPISTSWQTVGGYVQVGESIPEGIAQGIKNREDVIYQALYGSMMAGIAVAKGAIQSHSPSKKYADMVGSTIPTGIAKGIKDNISSLEKTTNWMMGYTFPKSNSKIATAIGSMSSAGYANTQNTMNATYNMTVNGVAGQDINALSNIIMRKIQSATERKGSIWK